MDWTPAFTGPDGAFLHDFSYAGYHRGEAPIPDAGSLPGATFSILDDGADPLGVEDATAAIQATIDAASIAGGVVLVPVGTYRVDGLLTVTSSGVVLRGEGPGSRRVRWRDPDGKARSRQCPTMAAAQALLREVEDAVALGRRWEPRDARPQADLRTLLKDYAEECARVLRPGTAVRYALGLDLLPRYLERVHGKGAPSRRPC